MIGTATNAGLRRKARMARDEHQSRAMSPQRALRLALEKTADEDLSLALTAASCERSKTDHAGLIAMIPDAMLLILIDGPEGATGVMAMDGAVLASLIEVQTMGQVLPRQAPARPVTRTDAALAAPLVDGVLTRVTGHLAEHPDRYWTCGYRFGAMIEDRRSLGLALTAPDCPYYNVFRLPLDIGPGIRMGEVLVALPLLPDPAVAAVPEPADPSHQLQDRVLAAPARLDAVLCRLHLPLSAIRALAAGDVLALPPDAMREVSIEVAGARRLATARLGKLDGLRALRLNPSGLGQGAVALDDPDGLAQDTAPSLSMALAAAGQDAASRPPRVALREPTVDGAAGTAVAATGTMAAFQEDLTASTKEEGDPFEQVALSFGEGPAAA
ncbi:MAG: FliM/FliN family flagellar motor C-terminal domain-containing protein [Paracoccaceae bacterium]|nr:FliM/FliN family flagellar motor C-terminal domain-containing protein [Paracoccaceae bacterium]